MGFVTRGRGATIHLQTCANVVNEREVNRLIPVEWEAAGARTYPISIRVDAYDRPGLLNDITQIVANEKVNIVSAGVNTSPDHTATVTATTDVDVLVITERAFDSLLKKSPEIGRGVAEALAERVAPELPV